MPVTVIDPVAALIVVDLQQGLADTPLLHPMSDVVARSARLAAAFRARALPVVLVTTTGRAPGRTERGPLSSAPLSDADAQVVAALGPEPIDLRVVKQRWGAFTGTDLDETLRAAGVTQVVVTGVATSAGVESTARSAYELGYHVVIATDAVTDRGATMHGHSVERIFPRLGETATSAEIIALLR